MAQLECHICENKIIRKDKFYKISIPVYKICEICKKPRKVKFGICSSCENIKDILCNSCIPKYKYVTSLQCISCDKSNSIKDMINSLCTRCYTEQKILKKDQSKITLTESLPILTQMSQLEKPKQSQYIEPHTRILILEPDMYKLYKNINEIIHNIKNSNATLTLKHKENRWKWSLKDTINTFAMEKGIETLPLKLIINVFSTELDNLYYVEIQRRSGCIYKFYEIYKQIKKYLNLYT